MTEYIKAREIDPDIVRLVQKLGRDFPPASVLNDITNRFADVLKVFVDGSLFGILVVRGCRYHSGEMSLVIDHAVAEDDIPVPFNEILVETLWPFVKSHGFEIIEHRAHRPGIAKMLTRVYGEPQEWIFKKRL